METAGSKETNGDAERKGLGTPATRAAILEKLVHIGFAERKGKNIIPTKNGVLLVSVLPDTLISASLTAEWGKSACFDCQRQDKPESVHARNK